ncbi:pilus assembly protein [bacterium]|nr:pilus assembly protein [bacterium]
MARFLKITKQAQEGQVLVESAIVMPLMIFFTLGILQLILVQHARIATDYAAYAAARAGVVNNANPVPMRAAANIAVLPTIARTNDFGSFLGAYLYYLGRELAFFGVNQVIQAAQDRLGTIGGALATILLGRLLAQLGLAPVFAQVFIINPTMADFNGTPNGEIEFDTLVNPNSPDQTVLRKNVLSVAVMFNYPMTIPFANWILFESWLASEVGIQLTGAIWNAREKIDTGSAYLDTKLNSNVTGGDRGVSRMLTRTHITAKNELESTTDSVRNQIIKDSSFSNLTMLKAAANYVPGGSNGTYIMPLYSSYSMRMHSNSFKNNVCKAQIKARNDCSN